MSEQPHRDYQDERAESLKKEQERLKKTLLALLLLLGSGEIDRLAFYDQAKAAIAQAQMRAYNLGRSKGFRTRPLGQSDWEYLNGLYGLQARYLNGFLKDYERGAGSMPYGQRLSQYPVHLKSAFLQGMLGFEPIPAAKFAWVLGNAEHCKDCLHRAMLSRAKGGFTWHELQTMGLPGTGATACGRYCKCSIREIKGKR